MGLARPLTRRLVPAVVLAALAAACAQRTTPPWVAQQQQQVPQQQAPQPVPPPVPVGPPVVGLLLPLSGSAAKLGADFQDAAQLALFDVGDTQLKLVPRDTGDTPDGATAAAQSAIDAGAQLLLGPLFGRSTAAIAPVAASRGINVLSFSNDASVTAPNVYVLGFRPEEQVARIVDYAGRRGLSRFAALAPDNPYGRIAVAAWRDAVARLPGARVIGVETYGQGPGEAAAAVGRLVASAGRGAGAARAAATAAAAVPATPPRPAGLPPFDSLLIADGGAPLRTVVGALPTYNVASGNTRLLGTLRWQDDEAFYREPPAQGAWIASWPPEALNRFKARFQQTYKRAPQPLAVLAYDATALASLLARAQGGFGAEQLTDPQGFTGGSGLFRLRSDGLAEHGLAVLEVRNGAARVIDPAPTSFPAGLVSASAAR